MKNKIYIILISVCVLFSTGCKLFYPNKLLRTGPNYNYSEFPEKLDQEYKIASDDELDFRLYTKDGYRLIDITGGTNFSLGNNNNNQNSAYQSNQEFSKYTVEFDGMVKLPLLGRIKLGGLTIREAEKLLEELYSKQYKAPFAILRINNHRVFVFPGKEGTAKVYQLKNSNTTLFEMLADIGGIEDGKANAIKLIRGKTENPEVYLIDLTTINGIKDANMVLQANDIIYIEPRLKIAQRTTEIITPYLALISTLLLVVSILKRP